MNLSIPSVGDLFHIWRSKSVRKRRCFVLFDLQMCFAPQQRAIFGHRNVQKWPEPISFFTFWIENAFRATAACNFSRSGLLKLLRSWGALHVLSCKCGSRHSGVQFFQVVTSKIAPRRRCFVHFDLTTRFAPQRRAIFPDRNFKNGSGNVVFCTFWLENALRARAACHFSFLCRRATSAPAALASLLFEHQEPRIIEKTQRFATFLTFSRALHAYLLSSEWVYSRVDFFSADLTSLLSTRVLIFFRLTWLLYSAVQLSILSEVRKLDSKLPSIILPDSWKPMELMERKKFALHTLEI